MPRKQHYLLLGLIITLSAALRFTGLESKTLWLDEIITTLFSLGQSFTHIPLDRLFSLEQLPDIFTFNSQATCQTIAETVAGESTHPPIFFCLLHWWLGRMSETNTLQELVWYVRSLPALFGVTAVAAIYLLGRVAFSPTTGLIAAALMAVSPFAVYLSQEARHYTLPLLLITLALTGLIQIQQDFFHRQKVRPTIWIGWVIVNTIGLYIHYFFILALSAQIGAIILWQIWQYIQTDKNTAKLNNVSLIHQFTKSIWHFGFCILPPILFMPWLPILLEHLTRPETDWFKPFEPSWVDNIVPIYQIAIGWVLMAIALPVENQPLWIAIPCGVFMLGFAIALARYLWQKLPQLFAREAAQRSSFILGIFTLLILAEFLGIVYILGKDITSAVRYHFIYYPSICVLLAATLTPDPETAPRGKLKPNKNTIHLSKQQFDIKYQVEKIILPRLQVGTLYAISLMSPAYLKLVLVGILSSLFVVSGLVFQKPYHPEKVANNLNLANLEPETPLIVIVGYETFQEVALGLGFAWELYRQNNQEISSSTHWMFIDKTQEYHNIWPTLSQIPIQTSKSLNLWIVAPGLRQREYPPNLPLSDLGCAIDRDRYYRIGIPYQLYRCSAKT